MPTPTGLGLEANVVEVASRMYVRVLPFYHWENRRPVRIIGWELREVPQ